MKHVDLGNAGALGGTESSISISLVPLNLRKSHSASWYIGNEPVHPLNRSPWNRGGSCFWFF
ncbi:hypothetical protein M378DRAFT_162817 [Amanita muscaria Koide BX008]|uniref:Uncharacterized protein n=1 Tax=Amanita muscaria (strain Koide BX008) TaxID=946122 RepID=A0A0C2TD14_AMAMK|nr:hypothetical protein M378DRAFT_162817 [Amanita muscaria Koide BX008]